MRNIGITRGSRDRTAGATALLLIFILGVSSCSTDGRQDTGGDVAATTMTVDTDTAVPMRDGVVLRADIYKPAGSGPFPTLLYRTPYGKHFAVNDYQTHRRAVERGYAVVLQDVRGRYASDGIFSPYQQERTDGYDTIEWVAAQPWSNGKVGTYGLSYPGAVQWLAALELPPHLVAMAPAMTFSTPRKFFHMNGMFDTAWLPWIYQYIAPDARARQGLPGITDETEAEATWPDVADDYLLFRPLADLPYLRKEAPYYFDWLEHPPEDPWWDWAEIRHRYPDIGAAVLNLSGWHDDPYGPEGAVSNFNGISQARADQPATRTHLVLGPWVHGVNSTGRQLVGDLDFGVDAGIDYDEVILRFFDEYLRGEDTGLAGDPAVRYFVMGANEWRVSPSWPPQGVQVKTMCLMAADQSAAGALDSCSGSSGNETSHFVSNPDEPVVDPYDTLGPHDYQALAERTDVLTFDSDPLDNPLTIAGSATARMFVSCDCSDFDLWVRLLDVYPDGRAFNLMSPGADALRASYRDADKGRQNLEPGSIYELNLDGLLAANEFAAGHRVRLQVFASFQPHLAPNLQTGESEAYGTDARSAEITIYHDAGHRSELVLPVLGSRD